MGYFVRKISKGKWKSDSDDAVIKADALTSCLRTSGNTLSFWRVEDLNQIDEAKLAIASSNSNLDTFDIVVFSTAEMEALGAPIVATPGQTACTDLENTHRDLAELNSDHLIKLSYAVLDKVKQDEVERVTLAKARTMMKAAVDSQRLDVSKLPDAIKVKIGLPIPEKLNCTCGA